MKLKALAGLLCFLFTQSASAQIVIGVRGGEGVVVGGGARFAYQRGNLIVGGVYGATSYYGVTAFYPPPIIMVPTPRIVVKTPVQSPGYSQDTRGFDLDHVPLKKPQPVERIELPPKPAETVPDKPLPGVDVSKPRPPVRPGDALPEVKVPPKKVPPEPLAEPVAEAGRLIDLGLAAFRDGEYGLSAQRFRQATAVAPRLPKAWFLLAQAELAVGSYRDAFATIQAGMKIDKGWPRTPIQPRVDLHENPANFAPQLQRLADSVAANPNHPTLLFLIAHQLWFDGQRKDAVTLFHRARPMTQDKTFIDAFLAVAGPAD